jgi:prepilin-type N-terminal cleavage/methylation domain-containing protein
LRLFAKNAARPWGFTLIELLTVVAIIGVLATLLMSVLSTAKRKARQSVSVGNLRQIGLAFNMYTDDHRRRPIAYAVMVQEKYLAERSLLCAEDKITGNWAGLIEDTGANQFGSLPPTVASGDGTGSVVFSNPPPVEIAHSYFKSFALPDDAWDRIDKSPLAGIAACQLHGIGRQSIDTPPSLYAYQGLVLRGLKDSSVVTRQVFWPSSTAGADKPSLVGPSSGISVSAPVNNGGAASTGATLSELPLFLDDTQ